MLVIQYLNRLLNYLRDIYTGKILSFFWYKPHYNQHLSGDMLDEFILNKTKELHCTNRKEDLGISDVLSKFHKQENEGRMRELIEGLAEKEGKIRNKIQKLFKKSTISRLERNVHSVLHERVSVHKKAELLCDFHLDLHSAISGGIRDINRVSLLLKDGADPNEPNSKGNTPLHEAILKGNLSAIKLLLEYGADLFRENRKGVTPYYLSCGKALVEDLFLSDKETNFMVRVQVLNRNLEKLDKYGMSRELGSLGKYGTNVESTIKGCYPASTLKELCISKVLNCIEGEHNK